MSSGGELLRAPLRLLWLDLWVLTQKNKPLIMKNRAARGAVRSGRAVKTFLLMINPEPDTS
jgi:hypothetical protein